MTDQTTGGIDFLAVGVGKSTVALNASLGTSADSLALEGRYGQRRTNSAYGGFTAPFVNGLVLGFALDMDRGTLSVYRGGVDQGVAVRGLSGTYYPMFCTEASTDKATLNFGATAFVYSKPPGFQALTTADYFPSDVKISPASITVLESGQYRFSAVGGRAPYTYSVFAGSGSIDPSSGYFSAPAGSGSVTIRVTDAASDTDDATVTISNIPMTLNPSDKSTSLTLSNGSLTASASSNTLVRALAAKTSGKWYWEVADDTVGPVYSGLLSGDYPLNTGEYPGSHSTLQGQAISSADGAVKSRGGSTAYLGAAVTAGTKIGYALDLRYDKKLWIVESLSIAA